MAEEVADPKVVRDEYHTSDSEEEEEEGSDEESSEVSGEDSSWISWFCSLRGNDFFCEVDEDYILDDFNLTGLPAQVPYYDYALDTVLDSETTHAENLTEDQQDMVDSAAELLYGLIHARYIITQRGLNAMYVKFKDVDFGRCHRVYCQGQPVIPCGQSDVPRKTTVNVYCPRCNDLYFPKSSRQGNIDGAYFGTTFPHLFMMTFPNLIPRGSTQIYVPRIFGFKVHKSSAAFIANARQKGEEELRAKTTARLKKRREQVAALRDKAGDKSQAATGGSGGSGAADASTSKGAEAEASAAGAGAGAADEGDDGEEGHARGGGAGSATNGAAGAGGGVDVAGGGGGGGDDGGSGGGDGGGAEAAAGGGEREGAAPADGGAAADGAVAAGVGTVAGDAGPTPTKAAWAEPAEAR